MSGNENSGIIFKPEITFVFVELQFLGHSRSSAKDRSSSVREKSRPSNLKLSKKESNERSSNPTAK